MHRLRSTVRAVETGAELPPLSAREECRRKPVDDGAPGVDRRKAPQRKTERHRGLVHRASITFRGKKALVGVVNISRGGLTIETRILPEVDETVEVELPGAAPTAGTVRWARRGLVGIDMGNGEEFSPGLY